MLGILNSKITKYAGIGPMRGLEIGNPTYNLFGFKRKKKRKRKIQGKLESKHYKQ